MGNKDNDLWTCIYRESNIACMQRKQLEDCDDVSESRKICALCLKGQELDMMEDLAI